MATGPRQTEIDSADDLFLDGLDLESEGEERAETEQDEAPPEEAPLEEAPADEAPADEAPAEKAPPPSPVDEFEDDEGEKAPKKKRKKGPPFLQYYAIPVVGVILIMSLGWTLAFIARRGLVPPSKPEKTAEVKKEEKPVLVEKKKFIKPKRDLRTVRLPKRETKEGSVKGQEGTFVAKIKEPRPPEPKAPAVKESVGETKPYEPPPQEVPAAPQEALQPPPEKDTGVSLTVPVNHPFFIPLRGNGRGRNGNKSQRTVFLNFSVNLLVSSKSAASEFNSKRALIREAIYLHYSRLSPNDLSTPARRERVRRRLVGKLDKKIVQGKVRGILFREFYTR